MRSTEREAIVLRAVEFGEADLIAHLLTPETGRLTVIAKHARKSQRRFPGSLDLFNHLRIRVSRRRGSGLGFLEQAILLNPFLELRQVAGRYGLASYLIELLDRMAPEDGASADTSRIFEFALGALRAIAQMQPTSQLRCLMELRAFDALGLRPQLERCVRCGAPPRGDHLGFHVSDGGVICAAHGAGQEMGVLPVSLGTLRVLQQALVYDLRQLGRLGFGTEALREAEQILFRFQRFHLGFELKSERFLEASLRADGLTPVTA